MQAQVLEGELTLLARCCRGGDQRSLDGDGAAAAHRIDESIHRRIPAGQPDQTGREVFFQGCLTPCAPVAPLEQWLTGCVDIEHRFTFIQKSTDANLRCAGIDRGPLAAGIAKAIANCILDTQQCKINTVERRAHCGDIDPQRAFNREPLWPVNCVRCLIEARFIAIGAGRYTQQHPGGQPARQVDLVAGAQAALPLHAAGDRLHRLSALLTDFVGKQRLEAARAGTEEGQRRTHEGDRCSARLGV